MKIGDLGEFGFIDKIVASQRNSERGNGVGIGDDCAVIPSREGYSYVITTDMLIEGKHFLSKHITPWELGYKSLGVNLSDVASMGATPLYSFLSISLPPSLTTEWADRFLEGYNSFGIPLMGGDTTAANEGAMAISVTAIGTCKNEHLKFRSGAKAGDYVVVTGELGSSAAGFRALGVEGWETLKEAHHRPHIELEEGAWLGSRDEVTAMMDISDGVSSDIRHICKKSGLGANIEIERLPINDLCIQFCSKNGIDATELALSGGEDYKLLCTVKKEGFASLENDFKQKFGKELFAIGTMEEKQTIRYTNHGTAVAIKTGFTHF